MCFMGPVVFTPEKQCYTVLFLQIFSKGPPATNRESPRGEGRGTRVAGSSLVASAMRPRFKQRTFPGKPLSDEDVVHANRIAGEITDE
jgi:hypothetical protein